MKLARRPDVYEAVQWTGDNQAEITRFAGEALFSNAGVVTVQHGHICVQPGGWLVKRSHDLPVGSTLEAVSQKDIEEYFEPVDRKTAVDDVRLAERHDDLPVAAEPIDWAAIKHLLDVGVAPDRLDQAYRGSQALARAAGLATHEVARSVSSVWTAAR